MGDPERLLALSVENPSGQVHALGLHVVDLFGEEGLFDVFVEVIVHSGLPLLGRHGLEV